MRLSVIVPAFNEAKYLETCLVSIRKALGANAARLTAHELIVCDNNSTDDTAEIARSLGAQVVFEPHNQISRARNSGAKAADGDWFLFVDADCIIYPETIADMLDHIETGRYVGGGCDLRLDGGPWLAHFVAWTLLVVFRVSKLAGGAFVFCRADAFRDVGGFGEEFYAGEEVFFSKALKRWGKSRGLKFAFLTKRPILTSARKMQSHGLGAMFKLGLRGMFFPRSTLGSREHLGYFYDGKR